MYVSAALCGNSGTSCMITTSNANEVDNVLNSAISKIIEYTSVTSKLLNTDYNKVLESIRCSTKQLVKRTSRMEEVYGKTDPTELLKMQIAHLYLSLYNEELLSGVALGELEKAYNYTEVYACIRKLGIINNNVCPPVVGEPHTAVMSIRPVYTGIGVPTTVEVRYTFKHNDDVFKSINASVTNIPGVTLQKLNGVAQVAQVTNVELSREYVIGYSYERGGIMKNGVVKAKSYAVEPQWYGGESFKSALWVGDHLTGKADAAAIYNDLSNVLPVYQPSSNGTSSNVDTKSKYLWWVTKRPIKFMIGNFEIPVGEWKDACDSRNFAIIHTRLKMEQFKSAAPAEDMYFYRTCDVQDLVGMKLDYTLIQK